MRMPKYTLAPVASVTPATVEMAPKCAASTMAPPNPSSPTMGSTATAPRAAKTRYMERAMPKRKVDVLQASIACWKVTSPKMDRCVHS